MPGPVSLTGFYPPSISIHLIVFPLASNHTRMHSSSLSHRGGSLHHPVSPASPWPSKRYRISPSYPTSGAPCNGAFPHLVKHPDISSHVAEDSPLRPDMTIDRGLYLSPFDSLIAMFDGATTPPCPPRV